MYLIGRQHPESVTNISNLSLTHLVSNIRHQHRCNLWIIGYDSHLDAHSETEHTFLCVANLSLTTS